MPLRPSRPNSFCIRVADGEHRKKFFTLKTIPYMPSVRVHEQCDHNERIAIANRVQMALPGIDPLLLRELNHLARLCGKLLAPLTPMEGEWIAAYHGRKRRTYERVLSELAINPLHRRDRTVKAFIKAEKLPDEPKDPRMIQARGPRFNIVFGNYTREIEKHVYRLNGRNLPKYLPMGRLFAKGLNMRDRARVIAKMFSRFPCAHSLDLSRFDAHVSQELLRVCHRFYLTCFANDPVLRRLCSWQLLNNCYTKHWHYNSVGGRMSGDMDTALGNCILMLFLVAVAMRNLGYQPSEWCCFVDGDDTLVFTLRDLSNLPAVFRLMGQELKIEQVSTELYTIQHCQARPVDTSRGLIMCADPRRVMSRTLVGCMHWHDEKFWHAYVGLLGYCNLALHSGLPVLQAFAMMLVRWSEGQFPRRLFECDEWFKAKLEMRTFEPRPTPITDEARCTFAIAWGMEPDEQRFYERLFDRCPRF